MAFTNDFRFTKPEGNFEDNQDGRTIVFLNSFKLTFRRWTVFSVMREHYPEAGGSLKKSSGFSETVFSLSGHITHLLILVYGQC